MYVEFVRTGSGSDTLIDRQFCSARKKGGRCDMGCGIELVVSDGEEKKCY